MRLFIAIHVPKGLSNYCKKMQNLFPELKKTKDFHLTIQFLGDNIQNTSEIIGGLEKIEWEPFEIKMGDIIPFGKKNESRGIWIECRKNKPLIELKEKVRSAMKEIGYHSDKPFRPHITLGRYKEIPKKIPGRIKGGTYKFKVKEFVLIRSHLSEKGSSYETLAHFKLKEN